MNQYTVDGNKLREKATMEEPGRECPTCHDVGWIDGAEIPCRRCNPEGSWRNSEGIEGRWKRYKEHIASLKEFLIDPADWVGVKEVKEGEFELHKQMMTSPSHLSNMIQIWEDCSDSDYGLLQPKYKRLIARPKQAREEQKVEKPDCSKHPKDLFGKTDMKEVAEAIGNLHYETLAAFLLALREKLGTDAKTDAEGNRTVLSQALWLASGGIYQAYVQICRAWGISERFMKP